MLAAARDAQAAADPLVMDMIIHAEGEVGLATGDYAGLRARLDEISVAGVRAYAPWIAGYQGQASAAEGDQETAYRLLTAATDEARASGARRVLWTFLPSLAQAAAATNRPAEAARYPAEAQALQAEVAAQLAALPAH
jgi:hypothetical protein